MPRSQTAGVVCLAVLLAVAPARAQGSTVSLSLNIPALQLTVWRDGVPEVTYPVAAGRAAHPTPRGLFRITSKFADPWWLPPDGGDPVPPGPANPLGGWWLGINLPGYGLHGTNDGLSIGGWVSRGCVRLHDQNVGAIAGLVNKGTPVRIDYHTAVAEAGGRRWAYGETGLVALDGPGDGSFRLWTYPDVYRLAPLSGEVLAGLLEAAGVELAGGDLDWLARAGPLHFSPGAVIRFNGWEIGRGYLATARGTTAWLPWEVAGVALGLGPDPPLDETATVGGRTWVALDYLVREAGFDFTFNWADGAADFTGVAVVLREQFLTGAAFLGDGVAHVLASTLDPCQERVFLPVRPLATSLGREVQWDALRQAVLLR